MGRHFFLDSLRSTGDCCCLADNMERGGDVGIIWHCMAFYGILWNVMGYMAFEGIYSSRCSYRGASVAALVHHSLPACMSVSGKTHTHTHTHRQTGRQHSEETVAALSLSLSLSLTHSLTLSLSLSLSVSLSLAHFFSLALRCMGSYDIYGPKLGSYWDHIRVAVLSRVTLL